MLRDLAFVAADPESAATQLDDESIHLWRLPYASTLGRAPLLDLLGAYLGIPAAEISLSEDPRGKPQLAASVDSSVSQLEFNWSHSNGYALVALARNLPLGVDIEHLGKNPRALAIARRFFDPEEADALAAFDSSQRNRAFIALWCAKEAVLKTVGEGLSFGLARFAFSHEDESGWQLARADPALGAVPNWQLASFSAVKGYRGALAWRGAARRILAFQPHPDFAP